MATAIPRGRVSHPRDALSEWCSEGAIGGANEGTIDVAPGSLHQALGPIAGVLRAGGRHAITQAAIGLKVEDERRKSLAEKGWARRAVVVRGVGPCGGADLEQLPGREEYGGDEDGALDWVAAALQFAEDNFNGLQPRDERSRHPSLGLRTDDSPSRRGEPRQDALPIAANPCASLHPTG